jgi:hypothetical protein
MRRLTALLLLVLLAVPVAADARKPRRLSLAKAEQLAVDYADWMNAQWDEDTEGARFAEVEECRRLAARLVRCEISYVEPDADCTVAYVVRLKRNRMSGAPGTPTCTELGPDETPEAPDDAEPGEADTDPEPASEPGTPPPPCGLPVCPATSA